jgi:chromosome segregation ATPase
MSRAGINRTLVIQARQAILARGEVATIDSVRVELGNTGSRSTIQRHLRDISMEDLQFAREPKPPGGKHLAMTGELSTLIANVAERLVLEAGTAVASERAILRHERQEYARYREFSFDRIKQLQDENSALVQQLAAQRQRELELLDQLQGAELDRQRLQEAGSGLRRLLDERATHIQTLEGQLRHARASREHFEEHVRVRREQDIQCYEAQERELRTLKETHASQLSEIATLQARLEIRRQKDLEWEEVLRLHRKSYTELKESSRVELSLLHTELAVAQARCAALKERLRHYLPALRMARRQMRHMDQLQSLLARLAPNAQHASIDDPTD